MKLFHVADLHLGKVLHGRDLLEDQEHALAQLVQAARRERPAAVLLAGDIFDRAVPPVGAIRAFNTFIAALKETDGNLAIVVIPGNHDSPQRLSFLSGVLEGRGVHIRSDAEACDEPITVERGGRLLRIWALPYLNAGSFREQPAAEGDDTLGRPARGQEAMMAVAIGRIMARRAELDAAAESKAEGSAAAAPPAFDLLVAHAFALGCQGSDSERSYLGTAELVDASLFDAFDYAALGHLHRPQAAGAAGRYPGSMLKYSFADEGAERGFLIVELGEPTAAAVPAAGTEGGGRVEARFETLLPLRRMSRIEGRLDELLGDRRFDACKDDYVEATLLDAEGAINPMDALRARFPWILSLRSAAFERPGGEAAPALDAGARREPLDDFRAFHEELRGAPPDADEEALFLELVQEAVRAAD